MGSDGGYALYWLHQVEAALPQIWDEILSQMTDPARSPHKDPFYRSELPADRSIDGLIEFVAGGIAVHRGEPFSRPVLRLSTGTNLYNAELDALEEALQNLDIDSVLSETTWT